MHNTLNLFRWMVLFQIRFNLFKMFVCVILSQAYLIIFLIFSLSSSTLILLATAIMCFKSMLFWVHVSPCKPIDVNLYCKRDWIQITINFMTTFFESSFLFKIKSIFTTSGYFLIAAPISWIVIGRFEFFASISTRFASIKLSVDTGGAAKSVWMKWFVNSEKNYLRKVAANCNKKEQLHHSINF